MAMIDCPECGTQVSDQAPACPVCGLPYPGRPGGAGGPAAGTGYVGRRRPWVKIPNYLPQAILCTLCCCQVTGIVAIVYAAQVNGKIDAGDHAGALRASDRAEMWCWISVGIGVLYGILMLLWMAIGGAGT